jgi:nitric oxide reductase subunit B
VHRYGEDDLVMTAPPGPAEGTLSPWWRRAAIATMAIGFAVLILLTAKAYQNAPPVPGRAVDPSGKVVFTSAEIALGQQVFLKHGLMDNGTVWGHGAYLGPDFSAQHPPPRSRSRRSHRPATLRPPLC